MLCIYSSGFRLTGGHLTLERSDQRSSPSGTSIWAERKEISYLFIHFILEFKKYVAAQNPKWAEICIFLET